MVALKEKLALYHELAQVDHANVDLSENEVDILYSLSKDADVQAHLQRCIDADRVKAHSP